MSIQFDTFDTLEDRKELTILFQQLGGDLPDAKARQVRASWLQQLISDSVYTTLYINPDACHPVGAYFLFVQIVGVLGVSIKTAAKALDRFVTRKGWHETRNCIIC